MKYVFAFVLVVHGLIHLIGFLKEWNITPVDQLRGGTLIPLTGTLAKVVGVLWLIGTMLFLASAGGLLLRREWWWMVACLAVVVSQFLILLYWSDAWAGTVANLIILPVVIVSFATWRFDTMTRNEVSALFASAAPTRPGVLTRESVSHLPPVLVRWLERSGAIGREIATTGRLKQRGMLLMKAGGNWSEFEATQYFAFDYPGFVWRADVHLAPLIDIAARDKYMEGHGNMLIKALSLFPVADARGPEMDQGALLRYLAELTWFPTSVLNRAVTWEAVDSASVRATMNFGGTTASGVLFFNREGDFTAFEAQRFGEFDGTFRKELWHVSATGYKEFGGMRVACANEVTWKLKSGDFTWLKLELTDLEYNRPEAF